MGAPVGPPRWQRAGTADERIAEREVHVDGPGRLARADARPPAPPCGRHVCAVAVVGHARIDEPPDGPPVEVGLVDRSAARRRRAARAAGRPCTRAAAPRRGAASTTAACRWVAAVPLVVSTTAGTPAATPIPSAANPAARSSWKTCTAMSDRSASASAIGVDREPGATTAWCTPRTHPLVDERGARTSLALSPGRPPSVHLRASRGRERAPRGGRRTRSARRARARVHAEPELLGSRRDGSRDRPRGRPRRRAGPRQVVATSHADLRTGGGLIAEPRRTGHVPRLLDGRALRAAPRARATPTLVARPRARRRHRRHRRSRRARAARSEADEATGRRDSSATASTRSSTSGWRSRCSPVSARARAVPRRASATTRSTGWPSSLRLAGTGSQEPLWDRLHDSTMPVLVVAGARRHEVHARKAERLAAPSARTPTLALVAGAGHAAHLEQPDGFLGDRAAPVASTSATTLSPRSPGRPRTARRRPAARGRCARAPGSAPGPRAPTAPRSPAAGRTGSRRTRARPRGRPPSPRRTARDRTAPTSSTT